MNDNMYLYEKNVYCTCMYTVWVQCWLVHFKCSAYLILDNGGVVINKNFLNCHCWNLKGCSKIGQHNRAYRKDLPGIDFFTISHTNFFFTKLLPFLTSQRYQVKYRRIPMCRSREKCDCFLTMSWKFLHVNFNSWKMPFPGF